MSVDYISHLWSWSSPKRQIAREDQAKYVMSLLIQAGVGKRPVVFITHSQGGLLIKEVLRLACKEGEGGRRLLENTKAVMFLATPHFGSPQAGYASDSVHDRLWNPSLPVKQLRPGLELHTLNQEWCRLASKYHILSSSLAESLPTSITAGVTFTVVPPESANPGCGEFSILFDCDHININKPRFRKDNRYVEILNLILKAAA